MLGVYKMQGSERRKSVRKDIRVPIKYHMEKIAHGVLTRDLSVGGLSFVANHFLAKSVKLPVTVAFSSVDHPFSIMSTVAWVSSMPYGEQFCIGIKFDEMDSYYKKQIETFVKQH